MGTKLTLLALVIAGLFGGLIRSLHIPRSYEISLPFVTRKCRIGFLGDILVGVAASVGVYFVLAEIAGTSDGKTLELLRIVSLGLVAGYAGRPLLDKLSDQLTLRFNELDKAVDAIGKDTAIQNYLRISDINYYRQQYELAIHYCDKVLQLAHDNSEALLNKARALDKLGQTFIATDICRQALKEHPDDARAHYNVACYLQRQGKPADEIYRHLASAIEALPDFRENARTDEDFALLRGDQRFMELVRDSERFA